MKKLNDICDPNKTVIIHTEDKTDGFNIFKNVNDLKDNEEFKI